MPFHGKDIRHAAAASRQVCSPKSLGVRFEEQPLHPDLYGGKKEIKRIFWKGTFS